jgi:exonuclease III
LAVTKRRCDIIFLIDIRLNSEKQKSAVHDIEKKLFLLGYKMYANAKHSSRGVGILIHKNIKNEKFVIHNEKTDLEGNYILLDVTIHGKRYTIGAVYGPNYDDQLSTYNKLKRACNELHNENVILGGDFNATWDNSRVNSNIDVVNMNALPSVIRTNKVRELAEEIGLIEPYRFLNPNKKEYTYIPSAVNNMNRSRIDFFLVSNNLVPNITNCEIPHSLTSTLFDHKQIFVTLGKKKYKWKPIIKDSILKDKDLQFHVQACIMETYLHHCRLNAQFTIEAKDRMLVDIGRINSILRTINTRE